MLGNKMQNIQYEGPEMSNYGDIMYSTEWSRQGQEN